MAMSQSEKFFQALNQGRVVLVPPSYNDGGNLHGGDPDFAKFSDQAGAAMYPRGAFQVLVLDERPDA